LHAVIRRAVANRDERAGGELLASRGRRGSRCAGRRNHANGPHQVDRIAEVAASLSAETVEQIGLANEKRCSGRSSSERFGTNRESRARRFGQRVPPSRAFRPASGTGFAGSDDFATTSRRERKEGLRMFGETTMTTPLGRTWTRNISDKCRGLRIRHVLQCGV
jgi:hypothetical protein